MMVAQTVTDGRPDAELTTPALMRLLVTLSATTVALLLLLAFWMLTRRTTGQLHQPLSLFSMVTVTVVLVICTSLVRLVWHATGIRPAVWQTPGLLVWSLPSLVLLLFAVALSITGTGMAASAVLWFGLLAVEGAWWFFAWRDLPLTGAAERHTGVADRPPGVSRHDIPREMELSSVDMEIDESDESIPDNVDQQLTRCLAGEPEDVATGVLRAHFGPQERSHSIHVAFCPPMLCEPEVEVIQLSGAPARIKAADVQPFGIRFDLRLATASEISQDILLHFEAHCGKVNSNGLGGTPA